MIMQMADLEPCRTSKTELCKKLHLRLMTHSQNRTVVNNNINNNKNQEILG